MRSVFMGIYMIVFCLGCAPSPNFDERSGVVPVNNLEMVKTPQVAQAPPLPSVDRVAYAKDHPKDMVWHPVSLNPVDELDLFPEREEESVDEEGLRGRYRARMNIDQLDDAIRFVTGGIGWTDGNNNQNNIFEELSLTLGKPDYLQIVTEDLSASGLFLKFLDDAARSVCKKLVEVEVSERTAETRVLMGTVSPDANYVDDTAGIDAQLSRLSLLYHGISLQEDSGALENLRWLFQMGQMRMGQPEAGWEAVCVSLMTDPAFYSF